MKKVLLTSIVACTVFTIDAAAQNGQPASAQKDAVVAPTAVVIAADTNATIVAPSGRDQVTPASSSAAPSGNSTEAQPADNKKKPNR